LKKNTVAILKAVVWVACLFPVCWLVYGALTDKLGADQTAAITFVTGKTALWILMVSLAITPVRQLSARLNWLIKFRRLLGLFAFFYASLHLLTYIGLYAGFDINTMADDVTRRRFIFIGFATWLLLLPLAATSTNWAIRKLGGKRWSLLHKSVYFAALAGVIHYWWGVKPGVRTPLTVTIVLGVLLAARLLKMLRPSST
jgi:sulfoxide reductase heme-binding subunit YedZ